MIIAWLITVDFFLISLLLIYIAWQDIACRIVTHRNLFILLLLFVPLLLLQRQPPNIVAALLILLVGFLMFVARIIGGGDVKLVSILSLSMTAKVLTDFLFAMAIFGGGIAIIGFLFFRTSVRDHGIPYGVAICLAFIFSYPIT